MSRNEFLSSDRKKDVLFLIKYTLPRYSEEGKKLAYTLDETAKRLSISKRSFFELREKHPFYKPDGSRSIVDNPKKDMPLWSEELVCLIAFARSLTVQGVRQLSDDEGLKIRQAMNDIRRHGYLALIDE